MTFVFGTQKGRFSVAKMLVVSQRIFFVIPFPLGPWPLGSQNLKQIHPFFLLAIEW